MDGSRSHGRERASASLEQMDDFLIILGGYLQEDEAWASSIEPNVTNKISTVFNYYSKILIFVES